MIRSRMCTVGPTLYQIWEKEKTANFRRLLLAWYRRRGRSLPWRDHPTPYRVWISEIMLQQTRVRAVLPYYSRFLARFPDVRTLAEAPESEVLSCWAGLGYYRRAVHLKRAAEKIVRDFGGEFPDTPEEALKLPGVGRYTAGAVLSIAYDRPRPVVDGNVRRVIGRLHGIPGAAPESFCWRQADVWVPQRRPSEFNQAVMELGALVCLQSRPLCGSCPVARLCESQLQGIAERAPLRHASRGEKVELVVLLLTCGDEFLLEPPRLAYIPGDWGFPARPVLRAGADARARSLARSLVSGAPAPEKLRTVRHSITCRRILAHVYRAEAPSRTVLHAGGAARWFSGRDLPGLLTSSLFAKAMGVKK